MNYLFPAVAVTVTLVAGNAALGPKPAAVAAVPIISSAQPATEIYRVSSGGFSCTVRKAASSATGTSEMSAEPNCDTVFPGLAAATIWRENADGSVMIGSDPKSELLSLTTADGAAYETFRPADPPVTLTFAY